MRVPGNWTALALNWLQQQSVQDKALLRQLTRWQQQAEVPLPMWQQALQRCVVLSDITAPELQIGAGVKPEHVGKLGYLLLATDTLLDAMYAYQRYESLFYGSNWLQPQLEGHNMVLCWPAVTELFHLADAVALAALVSFIKNQVGAEIRPAYVHFRGQLNNAQHTAYEKFFACSVLTGQPAVSLAYPLQVLQQPMPCCDALQRRRLDQQMQNMLSLLPEHNALEQQLQQVLLRLLVTGEPTLENAAAAMFVSPRTLQRRLQQRGLSWQQWLDNTRLKLAHQYFADPALSLSDIALLLGFSEQSAFNRAFRRLTGQQPAKIRRIQLKHGQTLTIAIQQGKQ